MKNQQSNLRRAAYVLMGASVAALLGAPVAYAQQADSAQAADDGEAEEIVVTGQKMGAQSILEVPLTISAYSAETLAAAGVDSLSDIGRLSPSVELQESFGRAGNYLAMRGVSSTETGTPTVQIYVDGFTTGLSGGANSTLFGLERVEILEGPQATLYGRNAIGGVINYITRRPSDEFEAELRLTAAEYDQYDVGGRISGPLVAGRLFGELSYAHHERDGYLDNTATGEDGFDTEEDNSVRGALRAVFDNTTIDFSATYSASDDGCADCSYVPADYTIPLAAGFPPYDTSLRDGDVNVNGYERDVAQLGPHYMRRNMNTDVLTIEHDFGDVVLTSITGYGNATTDLAFDLTRAAGRNPDPFVNTFVIANSEDESISEELRLTGGEPGGLRWLVGGYYSEINRGSETFLGFLLPNPIAIASNSSTNTAVFVNAELPLGDHIVLGGGLRYDREEVEDENPLFGLSGSSESEELLPRATIAYNFDSGLMLYGTVSKGYKSGGVNVGTPDPVAPRTYEPEFLWNYEIGLKGRFLDNRVMLTLSAFHMDWTDRQVQLLDTSGLFAYQSNLGEAHIDGVELVANFNITPNFFIDGGFTYLDGEIDEYIDQSGISTYYGVNPDLGGNDLPNAPGLRVTVSPQWTTPIMNSAFDLRARADISYTGERYFDAQNLLRQDAYTLVNLYLGVERDSYEIGVFANNAFDEGYHAAGNLTTLGPFMTTGAPRVLGVRARLRM